MKPELYFRPLKRELKEHADIKYAAAMKKYMRNQFEFFGIKGPERMEILKQFIKTHSLPDVKYMDDIIYYLWAMEIRDYQYIAISLSVKMIKELGIDFLDTVEYMVMNKSWWDTVDAVSSNIAGPLLIDRKGVMKKKAAMWNKHENMWMRRMSIIFQLSYKERTNTDILYRNIKTCANEDEFFIRKAIGWALRQYARTDEKGVKAFVSSNELSNLSKREALKHIK